MLPCWKSRPSITRFLLKSGILLQVRDYESPGLAEIKKIRKKQFYLIKSTFVLCFGRGKCCHDEWKCAIKMILFKTGSFSRWKSHQSHLRATRAFFSVSHLHFSMVSLILSMETWQSPGPDRHTPRAMWPSLVLFLGWSPHSHVSVPVQEDAGSY